VRLCSRLEDNINTNGTSKWGVRIMTGLTDSEYELMVRFCEDKNDRLMTGNFVLRIMILKIFASCRWSVCMYVNSYCSDNKYIHNFSRETRRKFLAVTKIRMREDKITVEFRELDFEDYSE
jgi:hypothetical protein